MDWTRYLTAGLGATGLLTLAIVLILRGNLVPRSTLEMVRADKEREVETYKAVINARDETIKALQRQVDMLLEASRTTQRVIEALPEAARLNREGGGHALDPAPQDHA